MGITEYFDKHNIRYFEEFPEDINCPICGTNDKDYCMLIGIDGTGDGRIEEATPIHVSCLLKNTFRFHKEIGVIYHRV